MSRKSRTSILLIALFLACNVQNSQALTFHHSDKSNLKSSLIAYMKMLAPLESQEKAITNGYSAVTGSNYKSDAITLVAFLKLAPKFNSFISKIEAITPTEPRIMAAHNLFIEGWNLQDEALLLDISAMRNNDYGVLSQANTKLAKGRADIRAFDAAIKKLINQTQ